MSFKHTISFEKIIGGSCKGAARVVPLNASVVKNFYKSNATATPWHKAYFGFIRISF